MRRLRRSAARAYPPAARDLCWRSPPSSWSSRSSEPCSTALLEILADAVHMFTDAARAGHGTSPRAPWPRGLPTTAGRPGTSAEVFGALVNGIILIALAAGIAWEGIRRLIRPERRRGQKADVMLVAAIVGLRGQCRRGCGCRARRSGGASTCAAPTSRCSATSSASAAVIVAAIVDRDDGMASRPTPWHPLHRAAMIIPRATGLQRGGRPRASDESAAERRPTPTARGDPRPHPEDPRVVECA